jgi:hypothetical protein
MFFITYMLAELLRRSGRTVQAHGLETLTGIGTARRVRTRIGAETFGSS